MPLDPALLGHETPRRSYALRAADIAQFADAIADPNPLFRDPERARAAGFPAPIAPPTFVTRFQVEMAEVGIDPRRSQVLHAEQEYSYVRPLCAGDEVETWHRIAALRQSSRGDGMSLATIETLGQGSGGADLFAGRASVIVRDMAPGAPPERQRPPKSAPVPEGEPIQPLVKQVTQEQINAYADASGDHNPIHVDPAAARAVGLDGTIAHGMLSMAFLGQLVTDWLASRREPGGWLARLRVRFHAMVLPGDTLTCRGVVSHAAADGRQTLHVWAENQRGERVTAGEAEVSLGA